VTNEPWSWEAGRSTGNLALFSKNPRANAYPEDIPELHAQAKELLRILERDKATLDLADRYVRGDHDDPYLPDTADPEYKLLAERAVTNFMDLVVTAVTQQMYVDGFRTSQGEGYREAWLHWQRSRQDARQHALYRAAFTFGHAFTLTYKGADGRSLTKGLSPRKTAAIFDDPANDIVPEYSLTIVRKERTVHRDGTTVQIPGVAHMWDELNKYEVRFVGPEVKSVQFLEEHGANENPVTRFACDVDLDGRTTGLVLPLKPLQDRINESMFDLLVVQKGSAFKVRTATGMLPPTLKVPVFEKTIDPETGEEVIVFDEAGQPVVKEYVDKLDANGFPVAAPVQVNASRFMFSEDPDVKFDTLDETPLDGYISSLDMSIRHLSSVTQMPPDWLIGQIANLSAEALQAAERALSRKVGEYQSVFGESWERVFRLAAFMDGNTAVYEDEAAEVAWRDDNRASLSRVADALVKLKELGIPMEGLWEMLPAVTQQQLERWKELAEQGDPIAELAASIKERSRARELVRPEAVSTSEEDVDGATSGSETPRDL